MPLATSAIDDCLHVVVNTNTFEGIDRSAFIRSATDFDGEAAGSRLERRKRTWIRTVRISTSGAG